MAGVTSRALRHYDEIGLLRPAFLGNNGYRYYDEAGLLRLQQILLLRQLDLSLADIAEILAERVDELEALRAHHKRLISEQTHIQALADTVVRTIAELERAEKLGHSAELGDSAETESEEQMTKISRPENLFEGFDRTRYDDEARERWPTDWAQSKEYSDTLTADDVTRLQSEQTEAMIRVAEFMVANVDVNDESVQREIHLVYQGVCRFWTPNAAAFAGLGQMYVEDERFKQNYERIAEGLAEYYRDAMVTYAQQRLS